MNLMNSNQINPMMMQQNLFPQFSGKCLWSRRPDGVFQDESNEHPNGITPLNFY